MSRNMNCLCAINVDQNQQAFLAQMTSFVVRYDVIYNSFSINSQYALHLNFRARLFEAVLR